MRSVIPNPGLTAGCPADTRFRGGMQLLRATGVSSGFFAWHGTAPAAIAPICDTGFDPKRRSGQVHGPGEYFGVDPEVSLSYCKGGGYMIVAFLLRGPHLKTQPGFCHVVDNPKDWVASFSVPVLVVGFGDPAPPSPFPVGLYGMTEGWQTPFRWHWKVWCWAHGSGGHA